MTHKRQALPTVGDITYPITFIHGSGSPVDADLVYRSRYPLEVVLRLFTGKHKFVEWTFSRNLLSDALDYGGAHGTADIRLTVAFDYGEDEDTLTVALQSHAGRCTLKSYADEARSFIGSTEEMVPMCLAVEKTCHVEGCQEHELINMWIGGILT